MFKEDLQLGHWRFRKSITLLPGIRINFNKNSTSMTVGGRGLKSTFSRHGMRNTIGIPGTGISYTEYQHHRQIDFDSESKNKRTPLQNLVITLLCSLFFFIAAIVGFTCRLGGDGKNEPVASSMLLAMAILGAAGGTLEFRKAKEKEAAWLATPENLERSRPDFLERRALVFDLHRKHGLNFVQIGEKLGISVDMGNKMDWEEYMARPLYPRDPES